MSFQPIVPFGGYSGWAFLNRTKDAQFETFQNSQDIKRDVDYFKENISKITSAEDLVADRQLRKVALGAFGLGDDINNIFFIQKVLSDGTTDPDALANKLADKRYLEFSKAFGFGDFDTANTQLSTFGEEISERYMELQFEIAIGNQDENLRLAMNLDRELEAIASKETSDNGRWYNVMGNTAVRSALETALGLPSSLGALDLDQQLGEFRDKTSRYFNGGEVSQFSDPEVRSELVRLFLVRSEIAAGSTTTSSASNALALLTGAV
ncbi:DUF1217 domain-containing protein [Celeribacter sp.]|uniref:DUF1217 domain-containing protein n=1 Tax=Celeribacter sp. TaxID=1890673 RepID=UPI003A8FB211